MLKVTGVSHLDHGLSSDHMAWLTAALNERIAAGEVGRGVSTVTLSIPRSLLGLHTALVQTTEGVRLERRGSREWPSRVVDRPMRWTRQCTAVVGPHEGEEHVLYTAYGGPSAPREPGDPSIPKCGDCDGTGWVGTGVPLCGYVACCGYETVTCEACAGTGKSRELRASEAFWAAHALAVGGPPGIPESDAPNDEPGGALGHD
jgi:hypothetical protein